MDVRSPGWRSAAAAALIAIAAMLLPLTGPATAAEPTVEVTLVHAFAVNTHPSDIDTGPKVALTFDVYLDGQLVAAGLELGTALVLPDLVTPGTHRVETIRSGATDVWVNDVDIPDARSVDVAIGNNPAEGAGQPDIIVFPNDLSPVPTGSTAVVLRNVTDEWRVSGSLVGLSTPQELQEVPMGEQGAATVPAGFTEMRLIPYTCPETCSVLLQQQFPAQTRTIVYAIGAARDGFQDDTFDGVSRILGQEGGVLTVAKELPQQPPGFTAHFAVDVVCQAPGRNRTLALTAGLALTFGGIPSGTSCTVSEQRPPAAPPGWLWAAPVLDPADGTVVLQRGRPAMVTVTNRMVALPAIELVKSADANGFHQAGDVIGYTFTATNTGGSVLTGVRVSDPMPGLSKLSCGPGELVPGASLVCEASYLVTQADVALGVIRNTATVTGTDPQGAVVTDTDALQISRHLVDTGAGSPGAVAASALLLAVAGGGLLRQARRRTTR